MKRDLRYCKLLANELILNCNLHLFDEAYLKHFSKSYHICLLFLANFLKFLLIGKFNLKKSSPYPNINVSKMALNNFGIHIPANQPVGRAVTKSCLEREA